MSRISETQFKQLLSSITEEALSPSGTWSLKMHNELFTPDFYFDKEDTHNMISELFALLDSNTSHPNTKFKIAQLFSLMKSRNLNNINEILGEYKERILTCSQEMEDFPLSHAIKKLLTSLYQPINKLSTCTPPPYSMPSFVKSINIRRTCKISQTPDVSKYAYKQVEGNMDSLPTGFNANRPVKEENRK